jgi:two-component system, NarL family, response regulator DevR
VNDAVAPPRILVVDDHSAVRAGLARAIEEAQMVCCATAASKSEAMAQLAHTNPDAIVVDLNLPDGSGLDLIRWARKNSKEIAIVMLTMSDSESDLIAAMSAGASGFVKKSAPLTELISVLKRALLAPNSFTASDIVSALKTTSAAKLLTQREVEVLRALAGVGDIRALAKQLHITESTFKSHVSSIYQKFGVSNRLAAIRVGIESGII